MNRKILWSGLAIAVAATTIGAGAFATYVDSDTSAPINVTAGTLKLEVGGSAATVDYNVDNAYPGSDTGVGHGFVLQNTGTLPGILHVYLVKDADQENGMVDPETDAPDTDPVGGEIDNWLKVNVDGNSFGYGGTVPSMGLD
ncbi:MAG TPA: TasA family protein, partial [Acidimicrobiales bacterium]|nr:TasA family protein [Acidimicrobiales bacterium]